MNTARWAPRLPRTGAGGVARPLPADLARCRDERDWYRGAFRTALGAVAVLVAMVLVQMHQIDRQRVRGAGTGPDPAGTRRPLPPPPAFVPPAGPVSDAWVPVE